MFHSCPRLLMSSLKQTLLSRLLIPSWLGKALKELIGMLYIGQIPRWDLSKVRPAGAPLKTFGGRASGPEPLESLMNFTVNVFKNVLGRKLSSIEAHDVVCKIAEVVVVGGVRRSALISLSNLSDDRMRAQSLVSGGMTILNVRWLITVHVIQKSQISVYSWTSGSLFMIPSQVSVVSSIVSLPYGWHRRMVAETQRTMSLPQTHVQRLFYAIVSSVICQRLWFVHLIHGSLFGESEACNDSNTFQSTLVNFKYVSKSWRKNCEEERLLGVSLTGIMDCKLTNGKDKNIATLLKDLRDVAVQDE